MKNTIIVNKIIEPICEVFDKDNNKLGSISSVLEYNDIRLQINRAYKRGNPINGIYFLYKGNKMYINEMGGLINPLSGFYDTFDNQLDEMLQ